jgi:surface protein
MASKNTLGDDAKVSKGEKVAEVRVGAFKSVIASMARANESSFITEENFYILQWLYRIRRVSCARGLRVGFLRPDFLWSIYRPMMRSKKLLHRTNGDIRVAADLWCVDRAAAEERYGRISDWDVSNVTDTSELFYGKNAFNDDISGWDVSNVTDMSQMFYEACAFNQPVGDWDVSNVTNMHGMFNYARTFNQPVGDWDVSNLTVTRYMFCNTRSFNQSVGDWDVSKVTDMGWMFSNAFAFNQDLTKWNMRSVTYTYRMFDNASAMQGDNKPASLP